MTYLQFATGFKGGGVSPRPFIAAQAVPFNPEKLKSYEVGLKSDLFDRTLRVNGSVFFSKYNDLQLTLASCPQFGAGLPARWWPMPATPRCAAWNWRGTLRPTPGLVDGRCRPAT